MVKHASQSQWSEVRFDDHSWKDTVEYEVPQCARSQLLAERIS